MSAAILELFEPILPLLMIFAVVLSVGMLADWYVGHKQRLSWRQRRRRERELQKNW